MTAKRTSFLALFLILNLLFFLLVSAHNGDSQSLSLSPKQLATTMIMPNTSPKNMATTMPMPTTSLLSAGKCPRDALKLGVCVDVLGPLLGINIGDPPAKPCCSILFGLVDLEAAICLCTAIKANILGINLDIPIALSLLLDVCGKDTPEGYTC
ncbi:Bifunctional inhibitor/lipid-transfer protein/seed storage 2S albumin superfamily protein [Euphorbia peplus]|nr:Bifunctional inhibitor/lipid-transfer protein/seed storage 2S albumin superfamily protein [Euphorbia peplus]